MQNLVRYSDALIAEVNLNFTRYLYESIKWDDRLLGITGARGIGKTTLMLQYIRRTYEISPLALYVSLDHFYFQKNNLFDLAEEFYINGGRHLFIDEVHRYPTWSSELKNVYDNFPKLKIVFSGSSALQIYKAEADLSRRAVMYKLGPMSIREYLALTRKLNIGSWTLSEILKDHVQIAREIQQKIQIIPVFKEYLNGGVYPFFNEPTAKFEQRLMNTVNVIIENDLMAIERFSYSTLVNIRRILAFIADSVPFKPNISELARETGVSRDILLRIIDLLEKSDLLLLLKQESVPTGYLTKPDMIYLHNTALLYCLSQNQNPEKGTLRETFFVNQLRENHSVNISLKGDFLIDNQYVFEIGGKGKSGKQIVGIANSFVVQDDIEIGYKNFIPLWLFGFLY